MTIKIIRLLVILLGVFAILASGGGGGGDDNGNKKDTTPPDAPIISKIFTENNGKVTIHGKAEAESTVKITFPDKSSRTTIAKSNMDYRATSSEIQPSGVIRVIATDASGNHSTATTKTYIAPPQGKTFQLNIQNVDIRKASDGSNIYPQGKVFEGSSVIVE